MSFCVGRKIALGLAYSTRPVASASLIAEMVKSFPLVEVETLQENYRKNPSNEALKVFTLASAPYLFTQEGQMSGIKSLHSLPYNYETCQWSEKYFDAAYQAKWVPQRVPTLIMSGEENRVTPLILFKREEICRDNIIFKAIKKAGHFPWIENPLEVAKEFATYAKRLK